MGVVSGELDGVREECGEGTGGLEGGVGVE